MATQRDSFSSGGLPIAVEVFHPPGPAGARPAVIMLHGADGLQANTRYRSGAETVAAAGYRVFLVHYLDRTRERRASFATVFQNFLPWMETVRDALSFVAARSDVDAGRIGLVGISLGGALGLAVAAIDPRIRALVDYFGPLPQGAVRAGSRLPPTLILHGAADPVVPVANSYAVNELIRDQGGISELKVYTGQGHGFHGAAAADAHRRVRDFLGRHLAHRHAAASARQEA